MSAALDPATLFGGLARARGVVLAVSGGPDSTALMHLAAAWRPRELPMWVASVDHGLRAGSRDVAEAVVTQAARLDLSGRVLIWAGTKPCSGLQAQAREARYELLEAFCREVGASHLVLGHTLDDQAETVLMRLAAGSGLRGVAGMRAETDRLGLTLVRPLLDVRKEALAALCTREGWSFVADPANDDGRFARARWRRLLPALAAEGLTPERIGRLAARAARTEAALADAAASVETQAALPSAPGTLGFDAAALLSSPDEIALRVLADALATLCPSVPSRLQRLEDLLSALQDARRNGQVLRRTLQGCTVALDRRGRLVLQREPQRRRGKGQF